MITIEDEDIPPMMRFFAQRMKIVVEPTGAVAPAAVMKRAIGATGKRVCAIVSGGNVEPEMLKEILG
jgi:threonine dehydratase